MRVLSGSAGQAGLNVASGPAPLLSLSLFDVFFPPAIRHSGYKPVSHVDEAPQVAALGSYGRGAIASSYPETRIV